MALTQSARMAGPSWDEEVVPALRKRLESESLTLARRMSAISLSSVEEPSRTSYSDTTVRQTQPTNTSNTLQTSGAQKIEPGIQRQLSTDHRTPTTPSRDNRTDSPKPNGKTDFQRARTYSSPYASNSADGHSNDTKRPKPKPTDAPRALSPRQNDIKPTRIPRPSPLTASSDYTNGYSHSTVVTPELPQPEQETSRMVSSTSTRSTIDLPRVNRQGSGLLNESAPFSTDSSMAAAFEEDPPRPSMESEERPYEHWYRGEVSRNGGVGELKVGRRQEMLDIANYGHLIGKKPLTSRAPPIKPPDEVRKRAGSIAGLTNKERHRESLNLDDERANEISRVLDEHPPTDIDGDTSDVNSLVDRGPWQMAYAYLPDERNPSSDQWTTTAGAHETRSITPSSQIARSSSRQQQNPPPTRIPGPSSRRSSESRSMTTPTPQPPMTRSEIISSSSHTTSSPASNISTPSNSRQQPLVNNTVLALAQKRPPTSSPAPKKPRTPVAKAAKGKPSKANQLEKKHSVAEYPKPAGDGEDMADAIPSWTQPVQQEGNWDEVVLPVVARKKGMDGHYEDVSGGTPRAKKVASLIAPAPGTFGFDQSKYRTLRDFESIPMDEFGRPEKPVGQEFDEDDDPSTPHVYRPTTLHDEIRLPVRGPVTPPSPAPFADYAPNSVVEIVMKPGDLEAQRTYSKQNMEEEKDRGCCSSCVVM